MVHDQHRGLIIYFRVYSGMMRLGSSIANVSTGGKERLNKLFSIRADVLQEVQTIRKGDIGAAVGFKAVSTGSLDSVNNNQAILFPNQVKRILFS